MQNMKILLPSSQKKTEHKITQKIVKVNGEVSIKEYQRCRLLGRGGFAQCYLTRAIQTNATFATKIVSKAMLKNAKAKYKLQNQIRLHKTLRHKNIVQLFSNFEDQENVYIFLEVCPNESLNELLIRKKRFSVPEVQRFMREVIDAVKYLHQRDIIHRDLKLGNIFLGENLTVKLGDFGLATKLEFQNERKRSLCGTPNYIAPEIIKIDGYDYSVDIWSIGVMFYTLLIGVPPFQTDKIETTYDLIKKGQFIFPQGKNIPQSARSLITQILNVDPSKRPTLQDILQSSFMLQGSNTSSVLKCLTNQSINKSSICPDELVVTEIDKQNIRHIFVKQFTENSKGFLYVMSNGLIGLQDKDIIVIYSSHLHSIYLVTKGQNGKDILVKKKKSEIQLLDIDKQAIIKFMYCTQQCSSGPGFVYIRKLIKHKDFFIFRLSNHVVQLKFLDGCEILIRKNLQITVYYSGKIIVSGSYDDVAEFNHSIFNKKLRYLKDMIDVLSVKKTK